MTKPMPQMTFDSHFNDTIPALRNRNKKGFQMALFSRKDVGREEFYRVAAKIRKETEAREEDRQKARERVLQAKRSTDFVRFLDASETAKRKHWHVGATFPHPDAAAWALILTEPRVRVAYRRLSLDEASGLIYEYGELIEIITPNISPRTAKLYVLTEDGEGGFDD